MHEEWKQVIRFPDYEVSSFGNVRSKKGLLSPFVHNKYYRVNLIKSGVMSQVSVHELVLEAFVGPRPEGYQAHHKNKMRHNNEAENLEWVPTSEHRKMHRKLDKETIDVIRFEYDLGRATQRQLAWRYDVGVATINRIVNGKYS